jgi:hypothetical protein
MFPYLSGFVHQTKNTVAVTFGFGPHRAAAHYFQSALMNILARSHSHSSRFVIAIMRSICLLHTGLDRLAQEKIDLHKPLHRKSLLPTFWHPRLNALFFATQWFYNCDKACDALLGFHSISVSGMEMGDFFFLSKSISDMLLMICFLWLDS